jgi:hypothetical protein
VSRTDVGLNPAANRETQAKLVELEERYKTMDILLRLTQVGAESLEGWCGIVRLDTTSSRSETAVNSFTGMNPG